MRPRDLPQLLKEAASEWIEDGAMRLSSSLAYYAIFSLVPSLIIVMSIAGLVFGEEAARGQIAQQISALAGARARGDSGHGAGERVGKNDRRPRDDHRAGRVALWRVHGFRSFFYS